MFINKKYLDVFFIFFIFVVMLTKKEISWLTFLAQFDITVELLFHAWDGELYVTPTVKTPEGSEDLGTYLADDPRFKLAVFKHTKLLYRLKSNKPLNKTEQLLVDAEREIKNKVKYFINYIELHEIAKIGQMEAILSGFGYINVTKQVGGLSITQPIGYMGVDHHKKIFCYFNDAKKTIGKEYRMKNALYLY